MKKGKLLTLAAITTTSVAFAQVPSHPMYVQKVPTYIDSRGETKDQSFYQYFENWNPGTPLTPDDNFFISRVKRKNRFVDVNTQVNKSLSTDRKLCWWCPIGISDKSWGSIPRNIFNADNFSMWQYTDIHGNWNDSWVRVTGAFSDAAHKNGVENGCVLFFDSSVSPTTDTGKILSMLIEKENGEFKNARKLIRFMKYYGIDGLGVNPEGSLYSSMVDPLKEFFEECHKIAAEEDWTFKVHWYESMTNQGYVAWTDQLSYGNNEWFQRPGKQYPVSDMFMLNYNWFNSKLPNSIKVAKELGRSPYDVYAGFDAQGRWITDGSGSSEGGWVRLSQNEASIAIWGSHTTNMIYENANEFGSDPLTLQTTYQKKLEQFFTGGTRNPATSPAVTNSIRSASWSVMQNFHGMSKLIPARSVLTELPFVTRFCLGNGDFFNVQGKKSFTNGWYNIGVQDYLPTWRWWVVDDFGNVPADAINCDFTFEDSWFGGSALHIHGATTKSNIRLFKTNFDVPANAEISIRYKVLNDTDPHMNLIWSVDGSTFQSYPLTKSESANQWYQTTVSATEAGMTGKVASLGLSVENTNGNYEILIGEISIDNKKGYTPLTPTITSSEILDGRYNEVDFKVIFKSKDQDASKPYLPIYNEDVDTWYFEIYSQSEGEEPVLCTTTTSWASYVVGAPASSETLKSRFGVCAVAPDGITRSDIAWTNYESRTIKQIDDVEIDKSIIKSGETFTIKFVDPTHAKARSWEIINSSTGIRQKIAYNVTSLTHSITEVGSYDLIIKKDVNDAGTAIRGFIQISPDETGAIPTLGKLDLTNKTITTDDKTSANFTITRLGEGFVSRGLAVRDPEMLRLPETVANQNGYSIAMWFKVEKFAHGRFGTNLINKRNNSLSWPDNNWGNFWVHIWPIVYDDQKLENEISFTQQIQRQNEYQDYYKPGFNGNCHESPNAKCKTDGYTVTPNTWNHIVISVGDGKQRIWFNGKKVAEYEIGWNNNCSGPVYIGGTNVYHGGLIGVIDELQVWNKAINETEVADAMKGFAGRTIPSNLVGYWDFETVAEDGKSFDNQGTGGTIKAQMIKFEGGSGESTSTTVEVPVAVNNNELGNPAISGNLEVKTVATWATPGASVSDKGNNTMELSYANSGDYNVGVTLANRWGKSTLSDVVTVTIGSGIEETEVVDMKAFPNPFTDAVNLHFLKSGYYQIGIYSENGQCCHSENVNVADNELVRMNLDVMPGVYFVRVQQDKTCLKTLKLYKK